MVKSHIKLKPVLGEKKKKRKKTALMKKQSCRPDIEISEDPKEPDGDVLVSGWTPVHVRKQLVIGVNEVTRALERNELLLVLVCSCGN